MHVMVWVLFATYDTSLSLAIEEGRWLWPTLYSLVTLGSIASYRYVCWSDPGYATPENCEDLVEADSPIHTTFTRAIVLTALSSIDPPTRWTAATRRAMLTLPRRRRKRRRRRSWN